MSLISIPPQRVSIVIPIFNQAHFLEQCLLSLQGQSYDANLFDLILVDDGSTDNFLEIARKLSNRWNGACRIIRQPNAGPAAARNTGVEASTAEIIAFIDADCTADPNWIEALVAALTEHQADGVGGKIVNAKSQSNVSKYLDAVGFYRQRIRNGQVDYLLTGNAAFRRSALIAVGGFTVRPGIWVEDVDLSFRLLDAGYRLVATEAAQVTHYGAPQNLRQLAKAVFRYGRGSALLSNAWNRKRKSHIEFIRHAGAIVLSLPLALRLAPRVGLWQAVQFWPVVTVEHAAFCYGILVAQFEKIAQQFNSIRDIQG